MQMEFLVELSFDFKKSLEASAYLLELAGGSMEYVRLLDLLYMAERELLAEKALPLTGDLALAMSHGPVLSTISDMILDKNWQAPDWHKFIKRSGYSVKLITDPGFEHLSACIIDKLREVHFRHYEMNLGEVIDLAQTFSEWKKNYPGAGSAPIPLEAILEGMRAEEGTLETIREEEAIRRQMNQVIVSAREKLAERSEVAS